MNLERYQSIITKYNSDTRGNPIAVIKTDSHKVHPNKFLIQTGFLDETYRVTILNKEMYEVFNIDDIVQSNDFFVNYDNGIIFFHEDMAGETIQYRCAEIGMDMINASRVVSCFDDYGNVSEVLSDLIENVNNAVVTTAIMKENKEFNIPAESMVLNPTTELYEYKLNHGLRSNKIQVSVYNNDIPLLNLCRKLDSNNIVVANDEKIDITVVINYGSVN